MPEYSNPREAFAAISRRAFALHGHSLDNALSVCPGSGILIGPYAAITAKHVLEHLWDELSLPWKRGAYPKAKTNAGYSIKAIQLADPSDPANVATWDIVSATPCIHTDAAFLYLLPDNARAHQINAELTYFPFRLMPPDPGEAVWAFGYPSSVVEHTPGSSHSEIIGTPQVEQGEVVMQYPEGRGTWVFPHFETTAKFIGGMSGGPIVANGELCGFVSYGMSFEDGEGPSYAGDLWPLLLSEAAPTVDPTDQFTPVIQYVRNGIIRASGWEDILARATSEERGDGRRIARLRAP